MIFIQLMVNIWWCCKTNKLVFNTSAVTPLGSRYVDSGPVINHGDSDVASL